MVAVHAAGPHLLYYRGRRCLSVPVGRRDGKSHYQKVVAKYGDADAYWAEATARRVQHWGFNTLGTYASSYVEPTYLDNKYPEDAHGLHSHPTKLPFITLVRPGYYAMKNEHGYLPEPVKNLTYGASPFYTGYSPSNGIPDYFDTKLDTWLGADLATESYWTELRKSRYLNYLIGIACEDGDQTYGFGAGDQFPTIPSRGFNNPHLGWIVATVAPTQTANATKRVLYADTAVHTKLAWRDSLKAKYGTIGALNAAWGSTYTTFDSAGTPVKNEYVGTGDGRTTTFSHRFSLLLPTRFSVQFKLDSKIIAGDTNRDLRDPSQSAEGARSNLRTGNRRMISITPAALRCSRSRQHLHRGLASPWIMSKTGGGSVVGCWTKMADPNTRNGWVATSDPSPIRVRQLDPI